MLACNSATTLSPQRAGHDLGAGTTAADTIGGGLLEGTIAGSFTVTGPPVSGIAPFIETVTFKNQHGTLTIVVTGAIDITTGRYNASGPVTGATGKLSGATGSISISGVTNFVTGVFAEDISGSVCVDLAP